MDRKEELIDYLYHATEIEIIQSKLNQIKAKSDVLLSKKFSELTDADIQEAKALQKETLDLQAVILEHKAEVNTFLRRELS